MKEEEDQGRRRVVSEGPTLEVALALSSSSSTSSSTSMERSVEEKREEFRVKRVEEKTGGTGGRRRYP